MTDPHAPKGESKKSKKAGCCGKSGCKSAARAPERIVSDPHFVEETSESRPAARGAKAKGPAGVCCKGKKVVGDPHGLPDDFSPEYAGSPERTGKYPAGVQSCTTGDWERVYVSVAEVKSVSRLKDGSPWLLTVEIGGREKTVWAEAGVEGVEKLPGENILILDNLEALRRQNKTCNGKALCVGKSVVVAPASAHPGERVL